MKNSLPTLIIFTLLIGIFTSCNDDSCDDLGFNCETGIDAGFLTSNVEMFGPVDFDGFEVPNFYDFEGSLAPAAYNGQVRRIAQLREIVSVTRDEPITFDIAAALINEYGDQFTSPEAIGNSDIRTKIDELNFDNGDTSVADAFGDLAERLVQSSQNYNIIASNGTAGIITTGSTRRHVSNHGLEYAQILEKGLYGPLLYDQMVDDYIRLSQSCLLYTSPSPRDQRGSRMPSSA